MNSLFNNFIGHESNQRLLAKQLQNGQVGGAYLFYGPKGVGKGVIAREFSKLILDTENLDNNPNFHTYQKTKGSDVKALRNFASIFSQKPVGGSRAVVILEGADELSKEESNSLLKPIEEPSSSLTLILLASSSGSLSTIKSRAQNFHFGTLSKDEVYKIGQKLGLPEEQIVESQIAGRILPLPQSKAVREILQKLEDFDPKNTWRFLTKIKELSTLEHEEKDELLQALTGRVDFTAKTGLYSPSAVSYVNQKSQINLNKKLFWQGLLYI